jgi:flagellar biosynthesis protein FliQ
MRTFLVQSGIEARRPRYSQLLYCHVSAVPSLIIMGSGLDDWIYCRLLCTIFFNHSQLQELTINFLPRTLSILILILHLALLSAVLRCTSLYSHFLDSRSSTTILLQLLNSKFHFSKPLVKVRVTLRLAVYGQSVRPLATHTHSLYSLGSNPVVHTSHVIKNVCLLVRYLAIDVLLLRANFGNVFTEPLPSNDHTRHNTIQDLRRLLHVFNYANL